MDLNITEKDVAVREDAEISSPQVLPDDAHPAPLCACGAHEAGELEAHALRELGTALR